MARDHGGGAPRADRDDGDSRGRTDMPGTDHAGPDDVGPPDAGGDIVDGDGDQPKGFQRAVRKADRLLRDERALATALEEVEAKADASRARLSGYWGHLKAMVRLLRAWGKREYRHVPWRTVLLMAGAVVYVLMTFDAIPDFTPFLGLLDDVGVLGFVLFHVKDELDRFVAWESESVDGAASGAR